MTRSMNSRISCPTCRAQMTMETHFERWMRENSLLDSRCGIVRYDLDVLLHKYMELTDGFGDRTIQAMMFIEVKTNGAKLTDAQKDTLGILDQVLRNRRRNINGTLDSRNASDHVPMATVFSRLLDKKVCIRMFGGHVLRFEKNGPDDSSWIQWGGLDRMFNIDKDQLVELLRFKLDPDNPNKTLDIRRRYKSARLPGI